MSTSPVLAYIGLGSNLGDRLHLLRSAVRSIDTLPQTQVLRCSSLYESAAAEGSAGSGDFLNAVAEISTSLDAYQLLECLQNIELEAGRERPFHHAPRTLDLDILLYGELTLNDAPKLVLPHPHLWLRNFVHLPLRELAPQLASNQHSPETNISGCQILQKNWLKS